MFAVSLKIELGKANFQFCIKSNEILADKNQNYNVILQVHLMKEKKTVNGHQQYNVYKIAI